MQRDIFATQMLRVRHMNSSIDSSKFRVIAEGNGIDISLVLLSVGVSCGLIYSSRGMWPNRMGESGGERQLP
jgi:hypothetical protein